MKDCIQSSCTPTLLDELALGGEANYCVSCFSDSSKVPREWGKSDQLEKCKSPEKKDMSSKVEDLITSASKDFFS